MAKIQVKLVKSPIGFDKHQKAIVKALGFGKLNKVIEHEDSPTIRGMINKIPHLVRVEQA